MLDATVAALRARRRRDSQRRGTDVGRLARPRGALARRTRDRLAAAIVAAVAALARPAARLAVRRRRWPGTTDAVRFAVGPARPPAAAAATDGARPAPAARSLAACSPPSRRMRPHTPSIRGAAGRSRFASRAGRSDAHPRTALDTLRALRRPSPVELRRQADAALGRMLLAVTALGRHERVVPVSLAALLLVASVLSAAPAVGRGSAIGDVVGAGQDARIAVLGAESGQASGANDGAGPVDPGEDGGSLDGAAAADGFGLASPDASAMPSGPYLLDGTLLKPVAVDTSVPDGSDQLQTYRVRSGDTLTGIANRFGVSMMTIWWANHLTSKDALHVGQTLVIPPVTGTVVTVKEGDTLDAIARAAGVDASEIVTYNGLVDDQLVIGQVLVIPGGHGAAIPTPRPTPRPATRSTVVARPPARYSGGRFAWPVPGGTISQYFHSGHYAIDIANDWGSPIVAAAAGTVIFAGWKNNGGGYQVWISHGSNLYTTYNHMSSIAVGRGQHVGRGQFIGRVGATGDATGPHCHFEVWIGYVWASGSRRVNPLNYL